MNDGVAAGVTAAVRVATDAGRHDVAVARDAHEGKYPRSSPTVVEGGAGAASEEVDDDESALLKLVGHVFSPAAVASGGRAAAR